MVTVELDFPSGLRSRDDVAFGGAAGGEAQSELTAVPIRMTKKRKLKPEAFQGVLRAGEKPLRVATAEEGPASLWIVRDESATEAYGKLSGLGAGPARAPAALPLEKADEVSFLWPRPRAIRGSALFPSAGGRPARTGASRSFSPHVSNPTPEGLFPMYADAVAVAGLNAFESFGRRAVLLLLGRVAADASSYRPEIVKRYLDLLPGSPLRLVARGPAAGGLPMGRSGGGRDALGLTRGLRPDSRKPRHPKSSLGRRPLPPSGD